MKEDKLNIDSFIEKEGRNYRKSEKLEEKEITEFFSKQGYEVIELQQIWRHVHGKIKKDGETFFLKMASTPDIGRRTKNESFWNEQIGNLVKKENINYFDVPSIHTSGMYENKFYYLSSNHTGTMLASSDPVNTANLEKWIDKIIKSNLFFLSLPRKNLSFPRDDERGAFDEEWGQYYQSIQSWHEEVKEHGLQDVFDQVKNLKDKFQPSVNHGDFLPWHMIEEGEKFILIDGEHGSKESPKYYDVCYFYHILYTSGQNPELAKTYLGKFRGELPKEEKSVFEGLMKPILAARIIGGFWDAKNATQTDVSYHNKLREDFLKNDLF